jgi:hypothetical protein
MSELSTIYDYMRICVAPHKRIYVKMLFMLSSFTTSHPTSCRIFSQTWSKLEVVRLLPEIRGFPRSMHSLDLPANAAQSMWNGADRFAMFHSNEQGEPLFPIWRKMKLTRSFACRIAQVTKASAITLCFSFTITLEHERRKQFELKSRI